MIEPPQEESAGLKEHSQLPVAYPATGSSLPTLRQKVPMFLLVAKCRSGTPGQKRNQTGLQHQPQQQEAKGRGKVANPPKLLPETTPGARTHRSSGKGAGRAGSDDPLREDWAEHPDL